MKPVLAKTFWILVALALVASCQRPQENSADAPSGAGTGRPLTTPGAPQPEELTRALGVPVEGAPGEVNQYIIRAPQGTADLTKIGKIHTDLGYAVGVTLPNGTQIGFRYVPPTAEPPANQPKN